MRSATTLRYKNRHFQELGSSLIAPLEFNRKKMDIKYEHSMRVEDIALVVYASLIQKVHTYGADDADRRKLATQSFLYADAFLAALGTRPS